MKVNSTENQEIKSKFVGQEVLHSANEMVAELLNGGFSEEIYEKFYSAPDTHTAFEDYIRLLGDSDIEEIEEELGCPIASATQEDLQDFLDISTVEEILSRALRVLDCDRLARL